MGRMRLLRAVSLNTLPGLTAVGWLGLSMAKKLRSLELQNVHPGLDGFAHLAKCESLDSVLFLNCVPTSDELAAIGKMKHLKTFKVGGAELSENSIASLKAALPKLIIEVDGKRQ
jgi:hypothetical protein